MIGVARITTLGTPPRMVAWVHGVDGPRNVLNADCVKPGEDRIVMYGRDIPWCQALRPEKLVFCEERIVYILLKNSEPIATRFWRVEIEELIAHHVTTEPNAQYRIVGLPI